MPKRKNRNDSVWPDASREVQMLALVELRIMSESGANQQIVRLSMVLGVSMVLKNSGKFERSEMAVHALRFRI